MGIGPRDECLAVETDCRIEGGPGEIGAALASACPVHRTYCSLATREPCRREAAAHPARSYSRPSRNCSQEEQRNRQLYDSMRQRLREANIASALRASNIRIVDPAEPPFAPYRPRPVLSGMLGSMIGLFGAAGAVLTRARLNPTLQSPN